MQFTAIIKKDSPRAAEWEKVFGTRKVAVHGFLPQTANVLGEKKEVYMLDLKALTDKQYEELIFHISGKFNVPIEQVAAEMPEVGVPILAEDLIITCNTPFFL